MSKVIEGPFSLGAIYTNEELAGSIDDMRGKHIAVDAHNHGAVLMVVYKMCDDDRNPELEAFAQEVVDALNYYREMKARAR